MKSEQIELLAALVAENRTGAKALRSTAHYYEMERDRVQANSFSDKAKEKDAEAAALEAILAERGELLEMLGLALPYVEYSLEDQGYKPGAVNKMVQGIRTAIEKAEGKVS